MTVTQSTVTQPVEGGVASQPVNRHMNALVGRAHQQVSVSECVLLTRGGADFSLDTQCCLRDSWRVAGKNLKFILHQYRRLSSPVAVGYLMSVHAVKSKMKLQI